MLALLSATMILLAGTVPASGGVPLGVIMGILVAVVAVAGFVYIAWRIR